MSNAKTLQQNQNGALPFLKDGMLAVIRAAIAAEVELARRRV